MKGGGRLKTSFSESSDRSTRRKTEQLRDEFSAAELSFAAQMKLRSTGAVARSNVIKDMTTKSPKRADKYRTSMRNASKSSQKLSADVALALVLDSKLTETQYQNIRNTVKTCNNQVFPPYKNILEAKKVCYPEDTTFLETCAEVP